MQLRSLSDNFIRIFDPLMEIPFKKSSSKPGAAIQRIAFRCIGLMGSNAMKCYGRNFFVRHGLTNVQERNVGYRMNDPPRNLLHFLKSQNLGRRMRYKSVAN